LEYFIGDVLIGNFDRHKDNLGFITNKKTNTIKLAPVYDCGACLYPSPSEEKLDFVLNDKEEINKRIFSFSKIALNKNDNKSKEEKFGYFELLSSTKDKECDNALKRIYPKIDLDKINKIIDNTPFISDKRKNFYKEIIKIRKEMIIDKAYEIINSQENI